MIKKATILLGVMLFGLAGARAQQTSADFSRLLYRNEMTFGATVHTAGWGATFKRLKNPDGSTKKGLIIDYATLQHPKEIKLFHPFYESARGYKFGKLNYFSTLRVGYGREKMIVGKTDRGSVAIHAHYWGGISNGITRPVYLEVIRPLPNNPDEFRLATEAYDPNEHFTNNIYGRASLFNGWDELGYHPGVFFKAGANFEYGITEEKISMLEVGIVFDYFFEEVPIMAVEENMQLFTTLYVSMYFGKKWN